MAISAGCLGLVLLAAATAACSGPGSVHDGSDGGGGGDSGPPGPDGGGAADAAAPTGPVMVYVGGGDSKIHAFSLERTTLAMSPAGVTSTGAGPSFLAFDSQARWLVAVNEGAGAIESYTIDAHTGALSRRDGASSAGAGPAHVALDRSGAWVLVANYDGNTATVLPINAAGDLGTATATVAPGMNAHQIVADAANTTVYVPCLGDDRIAIYAFDAGLGKLSARPSASSPAGAGPRHIALHPNGHFAYVMNEHTSTVTSFAIGAGGALSSLGSVSTLPDGFTGANTGAEIEVHPSGHFVYASNRGHDSIAVFAVGADGKLTAKGQVATGGAEPRHFSLVLGGSALLVANQNSGTIHGFRVDAASGALTGVGELAQVPGPQFVGAIALPAR